MFLRARALTLWLLVLSTTLASAQGTRLRSQYDAVDETDQDQPQRREQWFTRGRVVPKESGAGMRYRAHQKKMRLRALHADRKNTEAASGPRPQADTTAGWKSLGPSPLASDATGFGGQDYGWVSGRATAIAIDHADATGNTVYLGGGLWRCLEVHKCRARKSESRRCRLDSVD
jgi:hypothetical protein